MPRKKKENVIDIDSDMPTDEELQETEKRKLSLILEIQKGMPPVDMMKTMSLGTMRKQKEWEERSLPFIKELEKIEGKPTSVERYRPGR